MKNYLVGIIEGICLVVGAYVICEKICIGLGIAMIGLAIFQTILMAYEEK